MASKAFLYCFKVWITAICLGTIIHAMNSLLGFYSIGVNGLKILTWIAWCIVFGGGLAAPSLLFLWLTLLGLNYMQYSKTSTKTYLSVITIFLCLIQFIIGNNKVSFLSLTYSIPYILLGAAGIWYYKFPVGLSHQTSY